MIRNTIRVAAVLLSALSMSAALLAASVPASAASSYHIYEAFGPFTVGAPNLSINAPVVESSTGGRLIQEKLLANKFDNFYTYELVFNENTSLCVGTYPGAPLDVAVVSCSNGTGTAWALDTSRGNDDAWINRAFSQAENKQEYLTGFSNSGGQFGTSTWGFFSGSLQRFYNGA
jgi:hypothetical protein